MRGGTGRRIAGTDSDNLDLGEMDVTCSIITRYITHSRYIFVTTNISPVELLKRPMHSSSKTVYSINVYISQ